MTENSPLEPRKSRFPERVPGARGQGGVKDGGDFGARRQPMRHGEPLAFRLVQAQVERAQAAQAEKDILGPRTHGEGIVGRAEALGPGRVGGGQAEQQVGMTGQIFRAGLDGDIDARRMRRIRRAASPRCCR